MPEWRVTPLRRRGTDWQRRRGLYAHSSLLPNGGNLCDRGRVRVGTQQTIVRTPQGRVKTTQTGSGPGGRQKPRPPGASSTVSSEQVALISNPSGP